MDATLNRKSLALGIPGIALQIVGYLMKQDHIPGGHVLAAVLLVVGTGLLIAGLSWYAKAKGHSRGWGLLGLFSIIGLIVLAVLPDRNK